MDWKERRDKEFWKDFWVFIFLLTFLMLQYFFYVEFLPEW